MANNYSKIRELASKNSMGLSSSIKRDYGIPLDYSSIQETYEDALAYAKTSTLAYIGQPISVGDMLYIVTDEIGGYLKPVGTIPAGDELSITITDDGKIALKGFEAAANATLPRKKADGTIEWAFSTNSSKKFPRRMAISIRVPICWSALMMALNAFWTIMVPSNRSGGFLQTSQLPQS